MNCRELTEKFDLRLDGRLSADEIVAFDRHVASCADCARQWAEMEAVWKLIGQIPEIEPSFGFTTRTMRRLEEEPERGFRLSDLWWRPTVRWATGMALAFAVGIGAWVAWYQFRAEKAGELYVTVQNTDLLEDFDVIANLDQLDFESN